MLLNNEYLEHLYRTPIPGESNRFMKWERAENQSLNQILKSPEINENKQDIQEMIINDGGSYIILGPKGTGKTHTIMKIVTALDPEVQVIYNYYDFSTNTLESKQIKGRGAIKIQKKVAIFDDIHYAMERYSPNKSKENFKEKAQILYALFTKIENSQRNENMTILISEETPITGFKKYLSQEQKWKIKEIMAKVGMPISIEINDFFEESKKTKESVKREYALQTEILENAHRKIEMPKLTIRKILDIGKSAGIYSSTTLIRDILEGVSEDIEKYSDSYVGKYYNPRVIFRLAAIFEDSFVDRGILAHLLKNAPNYVDDYLQFIYHNPWLTSKRLLSNEKYFSKNVVKEALKKYNTFERNFEKTRNLKNRLWKEMKSIKERARRYKSVKRRYDELQKKHDKIDLGKENSLKRKTHYKVSRMLATQLLKNTMDTYNIPQEVLEVPQNGKYKQLISIITSTPILKAPYNPITLNETKTAAKRISEKLQERQEYKV